MIYFHTYKSSAQLSIDIVQDIRLLNNMSVHAKKAGMIILGGGVLEASDRQCHALCELHFPVRFGAKLIIPQRNGADYAVYINTGQEVS